MGESDLRDARRMIADWNRPPSDVPHAARMVHKADLRFTLWRRGQVVGTGGTAFDEYESEFEYPVGVETFLKMQWEADRRTQWDPSTKQLMVLHAGGQNALHHLHGQSGDSMALYWQVEAPTWPMKDREYVLFRRVYEVHEGAYLRIDRGDDSREARDLRPQVAPKTLRCVDHFHMQVAWRCTLPDGSPGVRVRSRYREDPMVGMPRWLLTIITEKALPRSIANCRKIALQREMDAREKAGERARQEASERARQEASERARQEAGERARQEAGERARPVVFDMSTAQPTRTERAAKVRREAFEL